MTVTNFQAGEYVDVTIRGVRVIDASPSHLNIALPQAERLNATPYTINLPSTATCPQLTVERVAPAQWPPRPGDVWRAGNSVAWFAFTKSDEDVAPHIRLCSEDPYRFGDDQDPRDVAVIHGPLALVYRPAVVHQHVAGWGGVAGECGTECSCGVTFDNFDTIAEAAEHLDQHIEIENPQLSDADASSAVTL